MERFKQALGGAMLVMFGAIIMASGVWVGSNAVLGVEADGPLNQSTEEVMIKKSEIIEDIVNTEYVSNKFVASRKANELGNFDIAKLNDALKMGVSVFIVPEDDVYESNYLFDAEKVAENQAKGLVTDCVFIAEENTIVISVSAPQGVLADTLNKALASTI